MSLDDNIDECEFMDALLDNAKHYLNKYHNTLDIIEEIHTLERIGYKIRYIYDNEKKEYAYEKYKQGKIRFKDE